MSQLDGQPSAAQTLLYTDGLGGLLKLAVPALGLNAPGEAGTLAVLADTLRGKVLGDGATQYGLGSPAWQSAIAMGVNALVRQCRYDVFFTRAVQPLISQLDTQVGSYLPSGWSYQGTALQAHAFDFHLTRLNACHANTPVTPTVAATLAATTDNAGAIQTVSSGNAPRVVYTWVYGDTSSSTDYLESLPSPESTQVALSGSQCAYAMTAPGVTVPANVGKARIYRGLIGGATGVYCFDQDVVCTPGGSFPPVTLLNPDANLRRDVMPPAWLSAMVTPEFAALFALCYATAGASVGTTVSTQGAPQFAINGQLSPWNVLLGFASGFVGIGNPASSAEYGRSAITGSGAQTWTPGSIQTVNSNGQNKQGYAGSTGIQARVTSALNGTCTLTISYTYLDAAHGQTIQTATAVVGSAFAGTAVGSLATFAVVAGRLVKSVTVTGVSGTATSGGFLIEGTIRSY